MSFCVLTWVDYHNGLDSTLLGGYHRVPKAAEHTFQAGHNDNSRGYINTHPTFPKQIPSTWGAKLFFDCPGPAMPRLKVGNCCLH